MSGNNSFKSLRGGLTALLAVGALLAGCDGAECLSGPACRSDDEVKGRIAGLVRVDTEGVPNVTLTLGDGTEVQTGSAGAYTFRELPLGTYTVRVTESPQAVTCETTEKSRTITQAEREATANFTCELVDGGTAGS